MTVMRILNEKGGKVETAGPETSLSEIAGTLATRKIGAIVILDDESMSGILSERDIVRAVAHDGIAALERSAKDYMTKNVVTCGQQETILRFVLGRVFHVLRPLLAKTARIGVGSRHTVLHLSELFATTQGQIPG